MSLWIETNEWFLKIRGRFYTLFQSCSREKERPGWKNLEKRGLARCSIMRTYTGRDSVS